MSSVRGPTAWAILGAMSRENVETVRRMHDAVGTPAALDYYDPEVVLINSPNSPQTAPYVGHAGLIAWMRDVRDGVDGFSAEIEEVIDVDESRVVVVGVMRGRGRASGLPFALHLSTVFTLKDARIVRAEAYDTKAQALEAVGRAESSR